MTAAAKRRKVLVILPSYDSGGAENYALRLIRHAGPSEFEWHVTTGYRKGGLLEDAFRDAGATTHNATTGFLSPRKAKAFSNFLRQHRFDAVMSLNGVFSGLAMRLAQMAGVPRRIAWHRRSTPAYRPTLARRLYAAQALRWFEASSTHILSNSRTALHQFHGPDWRDDDRFQVIPNGVDATRFRPRPKERAAIRAELGIPSESIVIGHIGRVDPAKDHDTLFAATRMLTNHLTNVHLLLAGTSTDSPEFIDRVAKAGLAHIYHGLGVRTDTERIYQAMDVFLFPSVTEGQPNALIEAMLSEVPVVASNIEPIRDAVPEQLYPRLFPTRDVKTATSSVCEQIHEPISTSEIRTWASARYDQTKNFKTVLDNIK